MVWIQAISKAWRLFVFLFPDLFYRSVWKTVTDFPCILIFPSSEQNMEAVCSTESSVPNCRSLDCVSNVIAHAQKPDFVFQRNGRDHLNRRGRQLSTTGSWGVHISGSNDGYTMFRGSVKGTGYPLHSPVSPFTSPLVRHHVPSHFNWTLLHLNSEDDANLCHHLNLSVSASFCSKFGTFIWFKITTGSSHLIVSWRADLGTFCN